VIVVLTINREYSKMPLRFTPRSPREQPPAGSHNAVITGVIDLGSQPTAYGLKPQVMIQFQLVDEKTSGGRPFTLNRRYNYTSHPSGSLRSDLDALFGQPLSSADIAKFDLAGLLGMTCIVGVSHVDRNDRTYANIMSVMQRPKGVPARMPCDDGGAFSLSDEPFDRAGFDALPQWIQTLISQSPEFQAVVAAPQDTKAALERVLRPPPRERDGLADDEIPF
jgi:hypothetical protein